MQVFIGFIQISYKNYTPHRVSEEYFCPQKFLALPSEVSPGNTSRSVSCQGKKLPIRKNYLLCRSGRA
jgi:hypothetical protein